VVWEDGGGNPASYPITSPLWNVRGGGFSRTFAFFCGLKIFERFFSEAPDEKGEFGVCDNLPRRQHEVMAEKMRGCF
jgi:hypothetical protein